MRRRILTLVLCVVLVVGPSLAVAWRAAPQLYRVFERLGVLVGASQRHAGPTVGQLLPLSSLVTLRVPVSDVLETRVHGVTGGITATVLVKGDVELSTDLSQGRFLGVDEASRTAVLLLPDPRPGRARLDHAATRIVGLYRDGVWVLVPGDDADRMVVNRAYAEAERAVAAAADGEALRDQARAQAERVLGAFFEGINWRVRVRWGDGP